jgi:CHAD domain-containing protein
MAFQLKRKETVGDGIKRTVRRQIEKALTHLRARGDPDETVLEVRKCFKRVRAALRLVRDDLVDTVYRRENFLFRDAARPLTEARDAVVLVETLDNLIRNSAGQIKPGEIRKVRTLLAANRKAVTRRVLTGQKAFATVVEAIEPVLSRLEDWTIRHEGWSALSGGLQCMYQAGYRALSASCTEPSVENLHEWRKQAKYLWHGLQLLESAWTGDEKGLGDQVHNLTRLLGENHDLGVLRQMLGADPLAYGGRDVLENLLSLIKCRRENLEQQAFVLGRSIYADAPTVFTKRMGRSWKPWGSLKEKEPQEEASSTVTSARKER